VAWQAAITRADGPTSLIFSRQGLAVMPRTDQQVAQVQRGGYVLLDSVQPPQAIIIATGSEVGLAMQAATQLQSDGVAVRVVSMPCTDVFEAQDAAYREQVLPAAVTARVAVEALHADYWYKYVGLNGRIIGMTTFGESAPGGELMEHFGFSVTNVTAAVRALV
jgi:transketolase